MLHPATERHTAALFASPQEESLCWCCAANLLRTASVSPTDSKRRVAAGRRWLRSYINGCGNKVWRAPLHSSLKGRTFSEAAEWAYRSAGFVLIGMAHPYNLLCSPSGL